MNNYIKISTNDGVTIKVEFNKKEYLFSISDMTIDTSNLIKEFAYSDIIEEIEIDDQDIVVYKMENETSNEFNELYKFIVSIPKAYNKAVNSMLELD